jgi:G-patch domain
MALYGHYEKPDKDQGEAKKNVVVVKPPSVLQTSMIQQHVDLQKQLQLHQELQQQEDDQVMHVGATLLRKMGWEGTAIGRSGAPAAKPLTAVQRQDRAGLGNGIVDSQSVSMSEGHCQHYAVDSKKSTMRNKMIARFQNIL